MPRLPLVIAGLLLLGALPAQAQGRIPGGGGVVIAPDAHAQMQRRMMTSPRPVAPYSMNYAEQVANSLGIRDGGVALYEARESARDPYAPSVSLGGTMLRLRWRQ